MAGPCKMPAQKKASLKAGYYTELTTSSSIKVRLVINPGDSLPPHTLNQRLQPRAGVLHLRVFPALLHTHMHQRLQLAHMLAPHGPIKPLVLVVLQPGVIRLHSLQQMGLQAQPARLRLPGHPFARHIAQGVIGVAAPNTGMYPGKPHLLQIDPRLGRPQGGLEILPVLINRNRMAGMVDNAAGGGVVEQITIRAQGTQKRRRYPQGPHGIEYANKVEPANIRHRIILAKLCRLVAPGSRCRTPATVEVIRLPYPLGMLTAQNAAVANQPRQRAYGISAPTKAKQIHRITRLVVMHHEAIAILNVLVDSPAGNPTGE